MEISLVYYYIYDSFLNDRKYDRVLAKIENRLANFEINGKITKLSTLKSIEDNVLDEVKHGTLNIVAVGDDSTVLKIINIIANLDNVTLGIIPLGERNEIARLLGIPLGESACEVLSSRKVELLDLGKVNNRYFISNIDFGDSKLEIVCDGQYKISPIGSNYVKICNICDSGYGEKKYFNPKDGFLEVVIGKKTRKWLFDSREKVTPSIFSIKKLFVTGDKLIPIMLDKKVFLKTPLEIVVEPQKLKVIVGKDRVF
ncbi:MAG: diacylglycerol kinase family protein [bacterium]